MSNTPLISLFKTLDNIKSAIELGNSTNLAADVAKLTAQVAAATAVSSAVMTYSALQGFGRTLSMWRMGRAVSGREVDIAQSAALAGFVASELVGNGIDLVRGWGPGGRLHDALPDSVNRAFLAALNFVFPRDPLVLDLDGDGIEATAINPNALVLFDHNADGIKMATGWISADDGIVVMDRDGNGTIDSGRELFGDNTLNGATPNPGDVHANGYAALAELDLNNDGKIDSSDAAYTQLEIWKDTNQNGISETGELHALASLNIASIGVVGTASNINLGNGNTMPLAATFTRTNGSTGTSGTPDVSGSLLLASNNFYREFTDDPEITEEAAALPQMGGSGLVRDLREAMSLETDEAEELQGSVQAFAAATTRQAISIYSPFGGITR